MSKFIIRSLERPEIEEAVKIQNCCWNEDYRGVVPENCEEVSNEAGFICSWLYEECEDIRRIYGVFEGEALIGFVGASIAEKEDMDNAMELNYLFLKNEYRNLGLGLHLINSVALEFNNKGFGSMIVYNWHEVPSNKFYRNIGGKVLKQVVQKPGGKEALVDIFYWTMDELLKSLKAKIGKKTTEINYKIMK